MVFFITFLRALATCLITNSHYVGVYPTDLIANGGLVGDIIFFAVSGYCLYNVKGNIFKWYWKRLWRCYLPVLIATGVFMLLGFYSLQTHSALWWFAYPTYYHFVASIVVLYIPYYVILKIDLLRKNIPWIMLGIAVVGLVIYCLIYDRTYYHIDTVREPYIRFLFMESMLLGAYFKRNEEKFKNSFSWWLPIGSVVLFVMYFASKLAFTRIARISQLQIVNQILIFALLYFAFRTLMGLDEKLERLPKAIKAIVMFLASMTLEIYVVQYVIIDVLRTVLPFPLNWLALTSAIIAAAYVLHLLCELIMLGVEKVINRVFPKNKQNEIIT